jgi:uncharacterized protein (TIGR02594 family)
VTGTVREPVKLTALDMARRFVGLSETAGHVSNPQILAMLRLDATWPGDDDIAWCSAFSNYICWLLDLPRSKSLSARSWLMVGADVPLADATPGFDVVILKRGGANEPGPEVLKANGHVGFYYGRDAFGQVLVLGGNQGDKVSIAPFAPARVLGVRRV